MKWRMYVSTTHIFCLYMLSDTEMNRQQDSCIHSLMEMGMSFAFCTVVRSPSIVASCIGVVINSQMISHTSLISNETFDRTYNDNCCFSFFFCLLYSRHDLFYRQQYGSKIEATTNQIDANGRSIWILTDD